MKTKVITIFFIIMSIITIVAGYFFNNRFGTVLDESIVSAGAFIMLIIATILQLYELNAQREDLKLTREEMKKHSEEFNTANRLTTETLTQTQFFELLRLKEEYTNDLFENNIFENFVVNIKYEIHKVICVELMKKMDDDIKRKIIEDNNIEQKYKDYQRHYSRAGKTDFIEIEILKSLENESHEKFIKKVFVTYNITSCKEFEILFKKCKDEVNDYFIGNNFENVDVKILKPYLKHKSIINLIDNDESEDKIDKQTNNLIALYNSQLHKYEKEAYNLLNKSFEITDLYFDYI